MTSVLAGLAAAVWIYPSLARWAVWRWLAAAATLPAVLAAGPVAHAGLASAGLAACCGAALTLLCRHRRPSAAAAGCAGVLVVVGLAAWWALGSDTAALVPWSAPNLLFVALPSLVAIVAAGGMGRASASAMRLVCVLPVVVSAGALVAGGALVALAWCPAAGALGLTALVRGRRAVSAAAPQTDEVDEAVLATFAREYGDVNLGPVVVVIAAYDEAAGLPAVLAALPREVLGLATDVLVVDDGSHDGTTEAARGTGRCYVAACPANRGQGAALRLGYRIARDHRARFLVTTDADGQYDAGDIAGVLAPVVDGRADFVTGSRRLGRQQSRDRVRRLGVHVFAWTASILLGRWFTDTSFGLRAMRAEVTGSVTLNQPQYQSSELLVGVVSHGFRTLEVPGSMHVRSAGSTKKGGNLVYGARYAGVMLGTWWREGCPAPVAERAPALAGSTQDVVVDVPA